MEVEIVLVNKNDYYYEMIWLYEVVVGIIELEKLMYLFDKVVNNMKIIFI